MKTQKEQPLNPEQSIDIIEKMLAVSRRQFSDNGMVMIIWSAILFIASLVNYLILLMPFDTKTLSNAIVITWIAFPILGGVVTSIYAGRQAKKQKVKTHLERLLNFMWIGYGITLFFVIYFSVMQHISPIPFILLLTGFSTFVYGLGLRDTPFIIGGCCFWAFAAISAFVPYRYQLLIFAFSVLVGYLVPGIMLYKKVKGENVSTP